MFKDPGGESSYLSDLFDAWLQEVMATVVRLAGEKRRPLFSPEENTQVCEACPVYDRELDLIGKGERKTMWSRC